MLRVYIDRNIFTYLKRGENTEHVQLKSILESNKAIFSMPFSKAHIDDLLNDKSERKMADAEFMEAFCGNHFLSHNHVNHETNYFLATPPMALKGQLENDEPRLTDIMDLFEESDDPVLQTIRSSLKTLFEAPLPGFPIEPKQARPKDVEYFDKFLPYLKSNSLADFFSHLQNTHEQMKDKNEFKEMRRYNLENLPRLKETDHPTLETINSILKKVGFGKDLNGLIEQHNQSNREQTLNEKFSSGFILLNFFGLDKEKNDKANFVSLSNDAQHAFYASYCDVLITEDKGLKVKSNILYENFGIPAQILTVNEFLNFCSDVLAKAKIGSLQQFTDFLNADIVQERFVKSVDSTKFKRKTHIYEPQNNYFDYFNYLEYIVDEDQGSFISLTSKKSNPLSNLFFDEFEIILNKIVDAFGKDAYGASQYNETDLAQLKENKWDGRRWITPNLKIILENNIGTGRLTLSIAVNVEEIEKKMKEEIKEYVKQKQIALSDSITGKTCVYLDVNYWINLKDQSLKTNPEEKKFYDLVSTLAATDRFVFPISEITFYEVLKRTDINSLLQTIEVIDRFSKGLSMVIREEAIRLEFKIFIDTLIGKNTVDTKKLIWTKLPFAAYPKFLEHPGFNMGFDVSVNKSVIDRFWNSPFSEVFEMLNGNSSYEPFIFKDNVNYFDAQKELHANENKTFDQLFMSELGGTLDLFDDIYKSVVADNILEMSGHYPPDNELLQAEVVKFRNTIYNLFNLKKINQELPSLRIFAGLFANNRWDKEKPHDKNDTMDFLHATFALPYCDYFITEKGMGTALKQNHLGYDKLYSCTVLFKEKDVLTTLNSLL